MSGPYTRTTSIPRPPPYGTRRAYYRQSTWYRTLGKRRVVPNPYNVVESLLLEVPPGTVDVGDAPNSEAGYWTAGISPSAGPRTANKALERFKNAALGGTDVQLATTLAEWKQSEKMIVARCGQILHAFQALRKGNVNKVFNQLGVNQAKTGTRRDFRFRSKDLAGKWLELHFGWVPLLQDIYGAVEVLQAPIPWNIYQGRASERGARNDPVPSDFNWFVIANYQFATQIRAKVTVDNPNLALANRMGLVNPASVAWELIPFSFLVDWFLPVGDFLNSFSDFLGYKVEEAFTTTLRRCESLEQYKQPGPWQAQRARAMGMTRSAGMPTYRLRFNTFKGFSPTRGATAVALVLQSFLPTRAK